MKRKFEDAFRGVLLGFRDHAVRLQWILAAMALCAAVVLRLDVYEWLAVILCIALVVVTETLNTAIERVCDLYSTAYNEKIQYIKDLTAGAVLIASAAALICALVILFRHIGGTI